MKRALLLLFLVACATQQVHKPPLKPIAGNPPSGYATTADGETIAYQYYSAAPGKPAVILLHMLRMDRTSWNDFASALNAKGYHVIVPDLRGHGQSTGNWEDFTKEDFQNMRFDVAAMKSVLQSRQADIGRLGIVGASIGANVAVTYAAADPDVRTLVLLSPGLEYRGVHAEGINLVEKPILIVASSEDKYSADSTEALAARNPLVETILYNGAGHGTQMFSKSQLQPTLFDWLSQHI